MKTCRDCKHFIRLEGIETLGLCPLESETLLVEAEGEPCAYFWPREEGEAASQIAVGDEFVRRLGLFPEEEG